MISYALDDICNSLFTEEELWAALRKLKASVSTTGDRLALTVKLMSAHTPSAQKLRAAVLQSFNAMWTTAIDTDLRRFIGPDCPRAAAIISRLQAGFMPGRSTTDQILLRDMATLFLIMFNPVLKAIEDLVARDSTTGIKIHTQHPDGTPLDFTIGTLAYADDAVALATGGVAGSLMMDVLHTLLGVNIGAGSGLARQSPEHINGVVKTARWLYICLTRAGITEVPIDTARVIYQCLYLPKITYGLGIVIADSRRLPTQLDR